VRSPPLSEETLKARARRLHLRLSTGTYGEGMTGPPVTAAARSRTAGYLRGPAAIALALLLTIAGGTAATAGGPRDARDVPLIDQNGAAFTLRDLHRPTAVIFVATRCGDVCPIAEGLFARLAGRLAQAHVDARLLTVTLDPEFDRPIVMAAKARAFGADASRWRWASGAPDDVRSLLDAFNVGRLDGKFHGTFAYVLDAQARPVRLVMLSTNADRELLGLLRTVPRG
jgi:cytochrome oxidase Cu insertion factor (SCO1/SenC/PrrC family)